MGDSGRTPGAGRETMVLGIGRIRGGVEKVDRRYEPAAFALDGEDFRLIDQVHLVGRATRDAEKVRFDGEVSTVLEVDCSRCLDAFPVPVDAVIEALFLPASARKTEPDTEVRDDDVGLSYYADDEIDLGAMMREQFYLALPMKPLCRGDCAGLCPVCGVNRNRETCPGHDEWIDPRFDALRKWRAPES